MMRRAIGIDVGTKHLAICRVAVREGDGTDDLALCSIEHWAVLDEVAGCTAAAVLVVLERGLEVSPGIDVVIERQPIKNPTMSKMQHYIEMYCASHGGIVHVQDSKKKLTYAAQTPWWPADAPDKPSYAARKKLAIAATTGFLAAQSVESDKKQMFALSKKKDDLADSFLHAMAFLSHREASPGQKKRKTPPVVVTVI